MKKLIAILILVSMLGMTGCSTSRTIDQQHVSYYGLFNEDTTKQDNVIYGPSWWNIFLGVIFSETIVVPIVVVGWYLFKPLEIENGK